MHIFYHKAFQNVCAVWCQIPPPITSIWVQELQQRGAGWQSWPGTPRQLRGKHGFRVLLHFCSISLVLSSEPIELTVCWPSVVYWCIFLVNFCYCFIAFFFLICTHILLYRLTSSILNACLFTRHISVLYQEAILVSSAMTSMTSVVRNVVRMAGCFGTPCVSFGCL